MLCKNNKVSSYKLTSSLLYEGGHQSLTLKSHFVAAASEEVASVMQPDCDPSLQADLRTS
jgi:hypothetical protein